MLFRRLGLLKEPWSVGYSRWMPRRELRLNPSSSQVNMVGKNRETADLKLFGGRLGAHSDRNNLAVLPGAIAGSISTAWGEISGVCK